MQKPAWLSPLFDIVHDKRLFGDGLEPEPSVFSSFQDQLGLKLESQKDQVEYLVIDHIEH